MFSCSGGRSIPHEGFVPSRFQCNKLNEKRKIQFMALFKWEKIKFPVIIRLKLLFMLNYDDVMWA